LGQIPNDRLTLELLVSRNDFGDTPLHAAAVEGHLKDVPPQFLNRTTLTIKNYTGATAIRAAIHNGHADQLPAEFQPQPPTFVQKLLHKTGFFRPPYA
jgi:ankyrin repeat protein